MSKIRLLIVEDQTIIRRSLCLLLGSKSDYEVAGEACNGEEAIQKVKELNPDIVIMDITMPVMDGVKAISQIKKLQPKIKVIILTMCTDNDHIVNAIKAGADCCVEKNSSEIDLFNAINVAHKNKSYLSPSICKSVVDNMMHQTDNNAKADRYNLLTPGEKALLKTIVKGKRRDAIAEQLKTSVSIIDKHLGNIMIKLGVNSIKELINYNTNSDSPRTRNKGAVSNNEQQEVRYSLDNRKNILQIYHEAYSYIEGCIIAIKDDRSFNIEDGKKIVSKIVKDPHTVELLLGKAVSSPRNMDILILNMVNVSIYAIKIGLGLKFAREKLIKLGLGGLVHDLGMFKLPNNIIRKLNGLNKEERNALQMHPVYAKKINEKLGDDYSWLAEVVEQEHERFNGHGYPHRLKGSNINEYAGIIGFVDVYESLTHRRSNRLGMFPFDAAKRILNEEKDLHNPELIRLLLTNFSLFPLESYVRLNSNAIAKIIEINKRNPLRPILEIVFDPKSNRMKEKKIVDLRKNHLIHIVKPVFEEDLPINLM